MTEILTQKLGETMTHEILSRLEPENALAERFSRDKASPFTEEITYEFTDDRALLHQYYHLREVMYRRVLGLDNFDGGEDMYDKISHILIARRGKLCIGGCRITMREPDETFSLPMETNGFFLYDKIKDGSLSYRHAETSRFAILSDRYEKDIMREMLRHMFDKLLEQEVKHLFIRSSYPMYRSWKLISTNIGFDNIDLYRNEDIGVPEDPVFPGLKICIARVNLPTLSDAIYSKMPHGQTMPTFLQSNLA